MMFYLIISKIKKSAGNTYRHEAYIRVYGNVGVRGSFARWKKENDLDKNRIYYFIPLGKMRQFYFDKQTGKWVKELMLRTKLSEMDKGDEYDM